MGAKPGPIASVTLLLSGCVAMAACSPAGAFRTSGEFRPSGATTSPPNNLSGDSPVLTQYRRFHHVFEYVLETNDESQISQVATGSVAARLARAVQKQRRIGLVRRGHNVINPRLADLTPSHAVVLDCVFTHGLWTYRIKTGARVGPPPRPQRTRLRTVLVLADHTWKVTETTTPPERKC